MSSASIEELEKRVAELEARLGESNELHAESVESRLSELDRRIGYDTGLDLGARIDQVEESVRSMKSALGNLEGSHDLFGGHS